MFDSKMHGGKYRQRPFLWSFYAPKLPDSFDWLSTKFCPQTSIFKDSSKWTIMLESERPIQVKMNDLKVDNSNDNKSTAFKNMDQNTIVLKVDKRVNGLS